MRVDRTAVRPVRHKYEVMNPGSEATEEQRARLRKRLGRLYRLGRPMTEMEVERQLVLIESHGLLPQGWVPERRRKEV